MCQTFQRLAIEFIFRRRVFRSQHGGKRAFEFGARDTVDDLRIALHEAPIAVPGKARVSGQPDEALDSVVVHANVENRVAGRAIMRSATDYTKHMIRLRRLDNARQYRVGDAVCEIILRNADDGTTAYELMAGLFRIRCLNSLVARIATVESIKVRHSGDALAKVIDGTYRVLGQAEAVLTAPQDWSRIVLDDDAKAALAESAHLLRFGDAEGKVKTPIKPEQLLTPRRADDRANDLWTVMNVVQENVMRGGLSAHTPETMDQHGRWRRSRVMTTRAINNIDQDVKLNKALWILGERMATSFGLAA